MRWHEITDKTITETASCGSTAASSVATVPGALGGGFDPNGDWGIYQSKKSAKKPKKKPLLLRR